jgi:hypothetical protein
MSNTDNAIQILIQRYSKLSNQSIEKIKAKFETKSIEEVIVKHEKTLTLLIVTVVLIALSLIAQIVAMYYSRSIEIGLILNILVLILFQKGLHDNYEIRYILKTLKEIGLH